jgi:hypothetical protein
VPGGGLGQRGEVRRVAGHGEGLSGLTGLGGELFEPGRVCGVRNRAVAELTT